MRFRPSTVLVESVQRGNSRWWKQDQVIPEDGQSAMKLLIRLLSIGVSLAAGAAARKALDSAWRKGTGNEPPKDTADLRNPLPGVLVFAVVTAISAAMIKVLTQRLGKKAARKLGHNQPES